MSQSSSRANSRSSSPEHNAEENAAAATPTSPEQHESALARAARQPDAPSNRDQLLLLVLSGSTTALRDLCTQIGPVRLCSYCNETYVNEEHSGSLFLLASLYNKRGAVRVLVDGCRGPSNCEAMIAPVIVRMLELERFAMVAFLVKQCCPTAAECVLDPVRGETLLHLVMRRPRPPLWFVQDLFQFYVSLLPPLTAGEHSVARSNLSMSTAVSTNATAVKKGRRLPHINRPNKKGYTALQIAVQALSGPTARDIVKLLLRHGADETVVAHNGKRITELCSNGYVRQYLAHIQGHRRGHEPTLDSEKQAEYDELQSSAQFPLLPDIKEDDIVVDTDGSKAQQHEEGGGDDGEEEEGRKKGAPLSQEEEDALVDRLYEQTVKSKAKWFSEQYRHLEEEDQKRYHGKQLAADEVEASVARLFQEALDKHKDKMAELNGKYIKERPTGPVLERDDVEACCYRLCKGTMEKKAAAHEELVKKYSPPRNRTRLSKEAVAASAQRLWKESCEKSAAAMAQLYEAYCGGEKTRFNGGRPPLTAEEVKALGDRLAKK